MLINGTDLYIGEYGAGKISKTDIRDSTPTLVDVVAGLSNPVGLALKGDVLYIAEDGTNKISKFDLTSLSTSEFDASNGALELYPNPSNKLIKITQFITLLVLKYTMGISLLMEKLISKD